MSALYIPSLWFDAKPTSFNYPVQKSNKSNLIRLECWYYLSSCSCNWARAVVSVTRIKSPNVYKSGPKMISLEIFQILTPLQNLPKNVGELGKLIVAKDFKKLPKVQKITKSGHTGCGTVDKETLSALEQLGLNPFIDYFYYQSCGKDNNKKKGQRMPRQTVDVIILRTNL